MNRALIYVLSFCLYQSASCETASIPLRPSELVLLETETTTESTLRIIPGYPYFRLYQSEDLSGWDAVGDVLPSPAYISLNRPPFDPDDAFSISVPLDGAREKFFRLESLKTEPPGVTVELL